MLEKSRGREYNSSMVKKVKGVIGIRRLKYLIWLIPLGIMAVIFIFSSQEASLSSEVSGGFTYEVLSLFPFFKALGEAERYALVESLQHLVRKTAHFTVYASLGASVLASLKITLPRRRYLPCAAQAICTLYAVSDEVHQLFVAGRSCEVRDVVIDSLGAFVGITALLLLFFCINRKKRCHNRNRVI